jgi:hypothetical protein
VSGGSTAGHAVGRAIAASEAGRERRRGHGSRRGRCHHGGFADSRDSDRDGHRTENHGGETPVRTDATEAARDGGDDDRSR